VDIGGDPGERFLVGEVEVLKVNVVELLQSLLRILGA
jgi:hypothetical protein